MLKAHYLVKELELRSTEALRGLLDQVPAIKVVGIQPELRNERKELDLRVKLRAFDQPYNLVCEIKSSAQPRHVRNALLQLENYRLTLGDGSIPVLMAPYLSPEAQAMCREQNVGYLDFLGNAWITFDGVYIERHYEAKPAAQRREIKSIFKPKSAQVLRLLLREPRRAWKVVDLARDADVSLGHVSNVRTALMDREWAKVSKEGLYISEPDAVLDAWRDAYEPIAGSRHGFYTTLHGKYFEAAVHKVLAQPHSHRAVSFASFSAAQWMAPYARTGTEYFYCDAVGLDELKQALKLMVPSKGENVVITVLEDHGVFRDTVEPAPGVICTSPAQTYLDLWASGERGREAAEQLRKKTMNWSAQ